MKVATFAGGRIGVVDGDGTLVDVTDRAAALLGRRPTVAGLVRAGRLDPALAADAGDLPRHRLDAVQLEPPLPAPGKIVGAPVNYKAHQDEMEWPTTIEQLGVFLKAPSSVIGPGDDVRLPYTDVRTDQEGELAIVIGRRARHVAVERALDHVAGYTCLLDITTRSSEDRSLRKSHDTFTPLGPWLATPDEVGDPGALRLRCWVNGELRQDTSTAHLIFSVPLLVAYASSVMTLEPGDVIASGTPEGVGPLAHGDRIAVEIERVGRLEVGVTAAAAIPYAERPTLALSGAAGPSPSA